MSDFKLIAIRPGLECDKRFTKVLNPGQVYPFYSGCKFYNDQGLPLLTGEEVAAIDYNAGVPSGLYDTFTADENPIAINISAIAGKNGSGKSTLLELLFAAIYVCSVSQNMLLPNLSSLDGEENALKDPKHTFAMNIEEVKKKREQLKKNYEGALRGKNPGLPFESLVGELGLIDTQLQGLYDLQKTVEERLLLIKERRVELANMKKDVQADIFYELDGRYYCLKIDPKVNEGGAQLAVIPILERDPDGKAIIQDSKEIPLNLSVLSELFFFTVAVNYSHYALNFDIPGMLTT